jgi:Fe-Mn family superoxide dismutase
MTEFDRRAFFNTSAGLAAGTVLAASLAPTAASAQSAPPAAVKLPPYTIRPMPFDPQKIHGLSERLLLSHYENNYIGAVKRLNSIVDQLASLDYEKAPVFVVNGLKREELIAGNSMILHEVFFNGLGSESGPGAKLAEAIARDFGSMERWRSQFTAMGRAEGGGSGWVILTYSPRDKRLVNAWAADHTTTIAGGTPILVMDMYEHAYAMDFGAKAANYVDTYMKVIKWENADRLYDQVTGAKG